MAKQKSDNQKTAKNSLVASINRRKKAGKSRKKKDSTISRSRFPK